MPFRCYIIGDDSLVIKCCMILREHGHSVLGVCTEDPACQEWAMRNDFTVIHFSAFEKVLSENEFDYLFSVSNKRILNARILSKPRHLAINYHNAPLPRYGGVYATAWAILNGEINHGITWHVMTNHVDEGDILLQEQLPISADDTMASLNTKCHALAAETFVALVGKLESKELTPVKPKGKPSYYSLRNKIHHDALVDWRSSAQQIERMFRALQAGPYLNQLGLVKIIIYGMAFIPRLLKVTEITSGNVPGAIVKIDLEHNSLQCTTSTNDVVIGDFVDIDNTPWTIGAVVERFRLDEGCVLPPYSPDLGDKLEKFRSEHYRDEMFWVSQFKQACPASLPYFDLTTSEHKSEEGISGYLRFEHQIGQMLLQRLTDTFKTSVSVEEILQFVVLMYLHRITGYENFSVSISNATIRNSIIGIEQFCAAYVPCNLKLEDMASLSFKIYIEKVREQTKSLAQHGSYERDILQRYIGLPAVFSLAICICNRFEFDEVAKIQPQNYLTIYISGPKLIFSFNPAKLPSLNLRRIAEDMFEHIITLLVAGLADDKALVVNLPILRSDTQSRMLQEWRGRALSTTGHSTLISMFEEIPQNPEDRDKIAIIANHRSVTYSDLDGLVNKLARYLSQQGIVASDIVAVSLETSVFSVVSLLAIMKLQATYMPLDPAYPTAQLRFMLDDARPKLLISRVGLSCNFPMFTGKIIYVDQNWKEIDATKRRRLSNAVTKSTVDHTAYIIYTSGTTGRPKGVRVSYNNLYYSMQSRFQNYEDVQKPEQFSLLLLLSTSFDTSIAAILWPLLRGGKLILPNPTKLKSMKHLVGKIVKYHVSHIICVPAVYRRILDYSETKSIPLKQPELVILGGDAWGEELALNHKKLVKQAFLFTEYGVTEASVCSTSKMIYHPTNGIIRAITLGKATPGDQILVLDRYLQFVPVGVVGELYLGGNKVARGYVNLEELSKERFIEYKLPNGEVTKLYKTGDLCCCTREDPSEGTGLEIRFRGRSDHQVKIRGYRIELQQIEKYILDFPNVKECVVAARQVAGEKHLVAYLVVTDVKLEIDTQSLRADLATHLPDYMIPSFFMTIDKLPLSRNYKIDREALPIPDLSKRFIGRTYVQHRNNVEEHLVTMWSNLLRIEQIGVFDNFFELGGDSLQVAELSGRIGNFFHTDVKMAGFLENPTIAYLASTIRGSIAEEVSQEKFDLMARDSVLDEDIQRTGLQPKQTSSRSTVFLTGATGFLGAYLLRDLLVAGDCKVYCLVRTNSQEEAHAKLWNIFTVYQLDTRLLTGENVSIITGDLEKPKFGLNEDTYRTLSVEVDKIYHCGAWVNHILDYGKLRATNVLGTLEVLRLASTVAVKQVFYISTVNAVSQSVPANGVIGENFIPRVTDMRLVRGGYAQTKLISERLMEQMAERGFPVAVFRICCWLSGDSETGMMPTAQNHLLSLVKGCIQMHCAPKWNGLMINMLPIDVASKFIIAATSQKENPPAIVYNVRNIHEIKWEDFIDWMKTTYNFDIELIAPKEWYKKLEDLEPTNALYPFLPHYLSCLADKPVIQIEGKVDDQRMQSAMVTQKLQYPAPDDKLLKVYFGYLLSGFLSPSLHLDCRSPEQLGV